MFAVRCTQCGVCCQDPFSICIKGRWCNLCARCAAAYKQKQATKGKQGSWTPGLVLAALVVVIGLLVWSFMTM
jgi:hypothetical protein